MTVDDNLAAFRELGFFPRIATGLTGARDLRTTVLSQSIWMPVIISPTGVQAVHPEAEIAVARATASAGTAMGLSSFASKPIEQVVAANAVPSSRSTGWGRATGSCRCSTARARPAPKASS